MAESSSSDTTLPIRCPNCGQRFKVGPDLMGRMVECGTCEHRFRVSDDVQTRNKRYYPGERRDDRLDRFSRVPMASAEAVPEPLRYGHDFPVKPPPGPVSPLRLMCGAMAALIILVCIMFLAFGSHPGGMLDGVEDSKRIGLAVFGAVLSSALIFVANPHARGKASLGSLVVCAVLISLPFIIRVEQVKKTDLTFLDPSKPADNSEAKTGDDQDPLADLKKQIGYGPMEAQLKAPSKTPGKAVAGLWLRDLKEYHKAQVGNYLIRTTGADLSSHMYPRPPDYLMVLTGVTDDLQELAKVCERFGEVRRVIPELRLIEVVIKNDAFQEGSLDKMSNVSDPAFYELNRRELESIDLERARRAVLRLSPADPKSYRPDIVKRMQQLLREGDSEMKGQIAQALESWATDGDGSLEIIRTEAEKLHAQKLEVPEALIAFLAKRQDAAAIPMVDELWATDPTQWERPYINLGPGAEPYVLKRFESSLPTLRMSAARILAKVGTAKSIPVLEAARPEVNGELKALIDMAVTEIRSRK